MGFGHTFPGINGVALWRLVYIWYGHLLYWYSTNSIHLVSSILEFKDNFFTNYYLLFRLTPESPRLKLTQNNIDEAAAIIKNIKRINKEEIHPVLSAELEQIGHDICQEDNFGVKSLFSQSRLMVITGLFCITWTVNDFLYIGGQMNVENLAGNQFVNFAIIGFSDLPSVFIGEAMICHLGRRWSHVLCMISATILFAACIPIAGGKRHKVLLISSCSTIKKWQFSDPDYGWLVTTLAVAAKTAGNIGWFVNYVQNMELFPTCSRTSGMFLCSTFATIAGIGAPHVILLVSKIVKTVTETNANVLYVGTFYFSGHL